MSEKDTKAGRRDFLKLAGVAAVTGGTALAAGKRKQRQLKSARKLAGIGKPNTSAPTTTPPGSRT